MKVAPPDPPHPHPIACPDVPPAPALPPILPPVAPPHPALRRALDRAGLVPAAARWAALDGGRSSRVYRVVVGSQVLVCKLTRPDRAGALFPLDPDAEARTLAALSGAGLAPRPVARFRFGRDEGLIYDHAEGRPLAALDPALAPLLSRLHAGPPGAIRNLRHRPALVPALVDRGRRHLAAAGWDDAPLLAHAAAALALPGLAAPRLIHGDPVPGNVLAGPRGLLLIDWQCAHLGDPVRDLALALSPAMHLAYGSAPPGPAEVRAFRAAYGDPAVLDRFDCLAVAFHLQVIGHCLWRLDRGEAPYRAALDAEAAALRARL